MQVLELNSSGRHFVLLHVHCIVRQVQGLKYH